MKGFMEKTRHLGSQVSGVGSRIKSLMRASDDTLSDLASDLGSTDSMAPEEAVAKMHAQNQALWSKLRSLRNVHDENSDLKSRLAELRDQLTAARKGKDGELRDAAQEIKVLKDKIRRLNSVCEDNVGAAKENSELRAQLEEMKFQLMMAKSESVAKSDGQPGERSSSLEDLKTSNRELTAHLQISRDNEQKVLKQLDELRSALDKSKSDLQETQWKLQEQEEQVAQCEALEAENSRLKAELEQLPARHTRRSSLSRLSLDGGRCVDTVVSSFQRQHSDVQQRNKQLVEELDQLKLQLSQLEAQKTKCQHGLGDLKIELQSCQKDLQDAEEERDSLRAMVEELQQHLDESSGAETVQLRMSVSKLQSDVSRLAADNEVLTTQLRALNANVDEDLAGVPLRSGDDEDSVLEYSDSEEDGKSSVGNGVSQGTEEKLIDLSETMLAEMAEIACSGQAEKLGISLSHVQYAGLLAAVQKAVDEVETAKKSSILGGADKFAVLERSLSNSLTVSSGSHKDSTGCFAKAPLDEIEKMAADRVAGVEELSKMILSLKTELQEGVDLTVQQEVRREYLLQQLSCPDKVIKLSWQVENLRKSVESSRREVEALKELNEQQQQELAIQWEKKQQAMAETHVHHSQASIVSEQFEDLKERTNSLTHEKQELEEVLKTVSKELQTVRTSFDSGQDSVSQQLAKLQVELTVMETERDEAQQREQQYTQEVLALQKIVLGAFGLVQEALQRCGSLGQWQRELRNEADRLELDAVDMFSQYEQEGIKQGLTEVDVEGVRSELEALKVLKERLEQDKMGLQHELSCLAEDHMNEVSTLQDVVTALEKRLSQEAEASQARAADLEKEISELQARAVHLESLTEAAERRMQAEAVAFETRFDALDKRKSSLEEQVQNKQKEMELLKDKLSSAESLARQEQEKAAGDLQSARTNAKKSLDSINRELTQALEEKKELQARVQSLQEKADKLETSEAARESLCAEVHQLMTKLSAAREECKGESQQLALTCTARDKFQQEASSLHFTVSRLEDKLTASGMECQRINEALAEAREKYAEAARLWEEELDAIAHDGVPRGKWPKAVRELVERSERAAREATLVAEREKLEALGSELDGECSRWRHLEAQGRERLQESEAACQTAQQRVEQLEGEMKEREQMLQAKVATVEDAARARQAELEGQVWELTERVECLEDDSQQSMNSLKSKLQAKNEKLSAVQERARILMAEKDDELHQLKAQLHASGMPLDALPQLRQTPSPGELDAIPTPTLSTARGLPAGPLPLAESRVQDSTEMLRAAEHVFAESPDVDGMVNEVVQSSPSMGDRTLSLPVVFEGLDAMGPVDVPSLESSRSMGSVELLKREVERLKERVQELMLDAEDNEHTHALRDKANDVLKREIADLQRSTARDTVDKGYLKNVLVSAFEKGTLSSDSPMVEVLARLLSFSPEEVERIQNARRGTATHHRTSSRDRGSFLGWTGLG